MFQMVSVVGFASVVVKLLIVKPLQVAIGTLQKSVDKMETILNLLSKDQQSIDKRLVVVEESAKSLITVLMVWRRDYHDSKIHGLLT